MENYEKNTQQRKNGFIRATESHEKTPSQPKAYPTFRYTKQDGLIIERVLFLEMATSQEVLK